MKACVRCRRLLPAASFYAARLGALASRCKDCHGVGERACAACGAAFAGKRNVKACSDACRKALRPRAVKPCAACGRDFEVAKLARLYCSNACKNKAQRGHTPWNKGREVPQLRRAAMRECLSCATPFRAVADWGARKQLYCSHPCYLRNRRVSMPERRVGEWLASQGLQAEAQKRVGRWSFDFHVPGLNLLVEVDGAFWHASETVQRRDRKKEAEAAALGICLIRIDADAAAKDVAAACAPVLAFRSQVKAAP